MTGLSPRQIRVLQLYVTGHTHKAIAMTLGIGVTTVKEYLKRVRAHYAEAGRSNGSRADLVRCATEDGHA